MKFTLSWLKDHLDTDADTATVAETLTRIGLRVEMVLEPGEGELHAPTPPDRVGTSSAEKP